MASVNKVILLGNLGADPKVRYTNEGTAVASLSLATNEQWTDGAKQERVEWHNLVFWGTLAVASAFDAIEAPEPAPAAKT